MSQEFQEVSDADAAAVEVAGAGLAPLSQQGQEVNDAGVAVIVAAAVPPAAADARYRSGAASTSRVADSSSSPRATVTV